MTLFMSWEKTAPELVPAQQQQLKQFCYYFNGTCKKQSWEAFGHCKLTFFRNPCFPRTICVSTDEGFHPEEASSGPCQATLHFHWVSRGFGKGLERTIRVAWFWELWLLAKTHYWQLLVWIQSWNFNSPINLSQKRSPFLVNYWQNVLENTIQLF